MICRLSGLIETLGRPRKIERPICVPRGWGGVKDIFGFEIFDSEIFGGRLDLSRDFLGSS